LATRRDRADEHAIADVVSGNAFAELFDNAHRLVADHQTRSNRIFTSDDVKVGSANRGERYADNSFACAGAWLCYLFDSNLVLAMKNICSHLARPSYSPLLCFIHTELQPGAGRGS
jgi:hypothetical protein